MDSQTILLALLGGTLIGLAAGALLLASGRIAGISGIYGGALRPTGGDTLWRVMFIAGLVMGGVVMRLVDPEALPLDLAVSSPRGWGLLIAAGLFVGFGTRLGSGCTSGHGVCGMSRLSARSIVATGTFMLAGIITVWIARHVVGG